MSHATDRNDASNLTGLAERLDRLEAENRDLRARVAKVETSPASRGSVPAQTAEVAKVGRPADADPVGRRHMLRTGLAAAGAAAAGAVLLEGAPAAAVNGNALVLGIDDNNATAATGLVGQGSTADYGFGVTDNGYGGPLFLKPALFAHALGRNSVGALNGNFDVGIEVEAYGKTGIYSSGSIIGVGTTTGVEGRNFGLIGRGVRGFGPTGVEGFNDTDSGVGAGVSGESDDGIGVRGQGGAYGVTAQNTSTDPNLAAIFASSPNGIGVETFGGTGIGISTQCNGGGIRVTAPKFHVQLLNGSTRAAPTLDAFAHTRGDLVEDSAGDLWLCVTSGTPGSWRKLGGPATAGAFHVLNAPVRVYDSRPNNPPTAIGPKTPLGFGVNRTIDLKANASTVPADATAVMLNILLVNAAVANGNFTVWANGAAKPAANTLVWGGSAARFSTLAVTKVDTAARCQVNASHTTDIVMDVVGYYR